MKSKSIPILKHPKNPELDTISIIKVALDTTPPGGFTTSEMRSRIKILDQLETVNADQKTIELPEADHAVLVAAVGQVRWNALDKFIIEFEDSLQ